ncbi:MAG: TlpA disulfide reductase family protein [Terriglobales bacterium]
MKRDPVVIIVVAMVITLMLVFGIRKSRRSSHPAETTTGMKIAPDFSLQSLDGKTVHLSDFRGKAILLNFWATWCEPCKVEMPWIVDLQKKYASQGLQVVGVAMDDAGPDEIAKFTRQMGVNYPVLVGKDEVADSYGGLPFLPTSFYIGRDGKIVDKVLGIKGRGEIEDDIKKALAQGQDIHAEKTVP